MTALMTGPLTGGWPASRRRFRGSAVADRLWGSAPRSSLRDRKPGAQAVQLLVLGRPRALAKASHPGRGPAGRLQLQGVPGGQARARQSAGASREAGRGGHRRRLATATSDKQSLQHPP